MYRCLRTIAFASLSILWGNLSFGADTLRCQSVNGNLNCAGSNGVSCQTINGEVCISGHGDIVLSFGNGHAGDQGVGNIPPAKSEMKSINPRLPEPNQESGWPFDGHE